MKVLYLSNGGCVESYLANSITNFSASNWSTKATVNKAVLSYTNIKVNKDVYDNGTSNVRVSSNKIEDSDPNSVFFIQKLLPYKVKLVNTDIINEIIIPFDDVAYYDDDGHLDDTIPTYYGDGTQWIKFKN